MKKITVLFLFVISILVFAYGAAEAKLPRDYQEFKARYQNEGRTMQGAAHLYFEAVFCYLNKDTRDEASKMVRYAMYLSMPLEQSYNYATFVNRMKDESYHYIFRSFAVGATPENSYSMSPDDFSLNFVSTKEEGEFTHLFLRSSGADSPRGIWMQQHDGLWYTVNNASTYAQVREPKEAIDARRNAHDADYDMPQEPKPVEEKTDGRDDSGNNSGEKQPEDDTSEQQPENKTVEVDESTIW